MASTITNFSNSINVNYPIPGQDNDSQGFRTNFSKIQSALNIAGDEITDLQLNSVNLNETNDFGNNIIKKAAFLNCSHVSYDGDTGIGTINVDLNSGSYQRFTINTTGSYNVSILGPSYPPNGFCGNVRLEIERTVTGVQLNFVGATLTGRTERSVVYNNTGTCIWDMWSPDQGSTLFANESVGSPTDVAILRNFTSQQLANWTTQTSVTTGTLVYVSTFNSLAYYNGSGWYTLTGTLAVLPVGDSLGSTY